jgi:hypothetical protein
MGYASTNETSTATHIIAVVQYRCQTETSVIDVVDEITPTLTLAQQPNMKTPSSTPVQDTSIHHIIMKRYFFGERYLVRFCSSLGPWHIMSSDLHAPRALPLTSASHGHDTLGTYPLHVGIIAPPRTRGFHPQ